MAHLCINCNAPDVRRIDDTFTCRKCGYRWDVAHEQANATYLLSQGRPPAESRVPAVEAKSEPETGGAAEGIVTLTRTLVEPDPGEAVEPDAPDGAEVDTLLDWLNAHTKAELVNLAAEYGIELAGDLRKADMVNTLAAVMDPGEAG